MEQLRDAGLIGGGIIVMGFAVVHAFRIRHLARAARACAAWRLQLGLMVGFVAGYLAALAAILSGRTHILASVTSLVFFGGAIFTAVAVRLTQRIVADLVQRKADLDRANRDLEARVAQRTQELATANQELLQSLKQLREAKEQVQVAERLASVGTLASGVAHEVNNPLTFLIANLEAVLAELGKGQAAAPGAGEDLATLVQEAREGALRIKHIVRGLMLFSRRDKQRIGPVDVRAAIESALRVANSELRHRARLRLDLSDLPRVRGDEAQIGMVFIHLLTNAAHAIPEGAAEQNEISVTGRREGQHIVVEVHDTGSGMPPEVAARLFEPFFTTKPVGGGTGLGLSICHGIVTALGGAISVETGVGKGSTFRVTLPIDPESAKGPELPAPAPPERRAKILIVDDEELVANSIRRILHPMHDADVLTSARQALEILAAGRHYDVVLCDVMMPELGGPQFYQELHRRVPAMASRLIFLTGGAFTPAAQAFLADCPAPWIEKPLDPKELRNLVRPLVGAQPNP